MFDDVDNGSPSDVQDTTDNEYLIRIRGRLSEAKRWFADLGWKEIPNSERGWRILRWGADQALLASPDTPGLSVIRWCRKHAPWMTEDDLDEIVAYIKTSNKRWSDDQCAMTLGITVRDRVRLGFRFLGASDDPHYEIRLGIKRAKNNERQRRHRAAHSTGRGAGRPALEMSPEEKKAHTNDQAAARMKAKRARSSTGRSRGRQKSDSIPAWQAAGFKNARAYQRHNKRLAVVAVNPLRKNLSRDLIRVRDSSVTGFSVTHLERHHPIWVADIVPADLKRLVSITIPMAGILARIGFGDRRTA